MARAPRGRGRKQRPGNETPKKGLPRDDGDRTDGTWSALAALARLRDREASSLSAFPPRTRGRGTRPPPRGASGAASGIEVAPQLGQARSAGASFCAEGEKNAGSQATSAAGAARAVHVDRHAAEGDALSRRRGRAGDLRRRVPHAEDCRGSSRVGRADRSQGQAGPSDQ